jgi:hypothetical protein
MGPSFRCGTFVFVITKGQRTWCITAGIPKRCLAAQDLVRSIGAALPLEYETILVDLTSGEPIAMKLAS